MTSSSNSNNLTVISEFKLPYEEFKPDIARKLAELIQQSYIQFDYANPPSQQHPMLGNWRLKGSYQLIAALGTQTVPFGFVASEINSQNVFVVFRGTRKFIEWFKDVNIQLVSYSGFQLDGT